MKTYVLTQMYQAPYVVATGRPNKPQQIMTKTFKTGQMVKGELKHANNKPAFVLVAGTLVLPLSVLKEVTTKEVISDASGATQSEEQTTQASGQTQAKVPNKKLRYIDAVVIGGLVGLGGVYLAEKQGWLEKTEDNKNRMYGALIGAIAGAYIVFRQENQVTVKAPQIKTN